MLKVTLVQVQDEVLGESAKYDVLDETGKVIHTNCSIELVSEILQQGTQLNKAFFDKYYSAVNYNLNKESGESLRRYLKDGDIGLGLKFGQYYGEVL